jgi:hypothetical protein
VTPQSLIGNFRLLRGQTVHVTPTDPTIKMTMRSGIDKLVGNSQAVCKVKRMK